MWNRGTGTFNSSRNYEANEADLLAGVYHPATRRKQVLERLEESLTKICEMDLRKETQEEGPGWGLGRGRGRGGPRKKSQQEDVVVMSLRGLEFQIDNLQKEVEKYEGPHFTRAYRTQQGLCSKLQTELDALDVAGREDIRKERKEALMRIDKLAKQLAQKSHPDGRSCTECEVRD